MSGLNLIQEYSSGTDEENDNLNDEFKLDYKALITKAKLPVPQSILSLKGVSHHEEVIDDPLKHNGRVRSFKHERGNWATLVYIDFNPSEDLLLWMKNVSMQFAASGSVLEEFHVSLTRTLVLKYHWIGSFVETVKNIAENSKSFTAELEKINIFCNEEKTRTFMGITIQSRTRSFEKVTEALDKALNEYNLPAFYKDASYHISFLWCLGDQRKTLELILPTLTSSFNKYLSENPDQQYVHINTVRCKIGNKLYNFHLK